MLAGCIPVFLFPPLHTSPFIYDFPWGGAAIFINITEQHSRWITPARWAARGGGAGGWGGEVQASTSPRPGRRHELVAHWLDKNVVPPSAEREIVSVPTLTAAYWYLR